MDKLRQHFLLEGCVTEDVALKIIGEGAALLKLEKTVLDIEAPVTGTFKFIKETVISELSLLYNISLCNFIEIFKI